MANGEVVLSWGDELERQVLIARDLIEEARGRGEDLEVSVGYYKNLCALMVEYLLDIEGIRV